MTAADKLASLNTAVEEAHVRWQDARERLRSSQDISAEFAKPIFDLRDAILFKQHEGDADKARRRETLKLLDQMTEEGLVFAPGNSPGSLVIVDPGLADREQEAAGALSKANAEKVRFEDSHAEEIQAAKDAEEAQSIRDALDGDDPAAICAALNPREPVAALTSSDLPT